MTFNIPSTVNQIAVLGGDQAARSLVFNANAARAVAIAGSNTLAIGSGGITVNADTASGHTIGANILLAAPQIRTVNGDRTFSIGGNISGSGPLTKAGSGTLTVAGNCTYMGITNVSGGTLLVHGTHVGGGPYTVANGATLGGTGTIGSSVGLASGGHLAPGPVAATFTIGSLSMASGAVLDFDLDQPSIAGQGTNSLLVVHGDMLLDGTLHHNRLSNFGPGTYPLMTYDGAGTFHSLQLDALPFFVCPSDIAQGDSYQSPLLGSGSPLLGSGMYFYGLQFAPGPGGENVSLVASLVPEPRTVVLLVAPAGLLAWMAIAWRRRKPPM